MIGSEIYKFAKDLWPINRSITGKGVRETLQKVSKHLSKLEIKSVPSGTKVFDWTVPKEWDVKEAYIITPTRDSPLGMILRLISWKLVILIVK